MPSNLFSYIYLARGIHTHTDRHTRHTSYLATLKSIEPRSQTAQRGRASDGDEGVLLGLLPQAAPKCWWHIYLVVLVVALLLMK